MGVFVLESNTGKWFNFLRMKLTNLMQGISLVNMFNSTYLIMKGIIYQSLLPISLESVIIVCQSGCQHE